ncbi:MAG: hypothetical protein JWL90_3153, partial [Chthoniobacteraceae bacterium]|nr:hypothetical protein [Chthoniobacteraceae bacterium]
MMTQARSHAPFLAMKVDAPNSQEFKAHEVQRADIRTPSLCRVHRNPDAFLLTFTPDKRGLVLFPITRIGLRG